MQILIPNSTSVVNTAKTLITVKYMSEHCSSLEPKAWRRCYGLALKYLTHVLSETTISLRQTLQKPRNCKIFLYFFIRFFFQTWMTNIFEEERSVWFPTGFGCKKELRLKDNRSAAALRQKASPLKSQITNKPDLCPILLPSPPP